MKYGLQVPEDCLLHIMEGDEDKVVSLAQYRKKPLLIVFYPKVRTS